MRRLTMVAGALAALAIPSSALANAAPANHNPGVGEAGWVGGSQVNEHITTTQYRGTYTDVFGPVACSGVHQIGKNEPSPGQDSFTCTSTTGLPLTNVYPGEGLSLAWLATFGTWTSDYYLLLNGSTVTATNFTGIVSADGMSYTAVATYS